MKKLKEFFNKFLNNLFFSDFRQTADTITHEIENETQKIKEENQSNENPIGYQITNYDGVSQVYSRRHVFKSFLDAMDFADNNNFLCGFEVRPVYAKDIDDPIYINSNLCR